MSIKDTIEEKTVRDLKDCTELYELCKGTNSSSRYVTVGISPTLNLAVRLKSIPGKMAVRVEGSALQDASFKGELNSLGLPTSSAGHCSMHVMVSNENLAAKTLGSIWFAIPVNWLSAIPELDKVVGKGE